MPNLIATTLRISELEYNCFLWKVARTRLFCGLIEFSGIYHIGSAGKNDALLIKWRVKEMWQHPQPISGLVVDFRRLDYSWGDDLYVPLDEFSKKPLRIVVTPAKYEAFSGVLASDMLRTDIGIAFTEIQETLS